MMKSIIEFGLAIALMAFVAGNLPKIVKGARKGQLFILKESSSSNWGKEWTPK